MLFRSNRFLTSPQDGDKILIRTKVSLFEARGNYQLIVEYLEPAGLGNLQRQFEALKNKLELEGLFSDAIKKTIPRPIYKLGLITSATGAAISDILSIIKRRFPLMEVILYPVQVQGEKAHLTIMAAIDLAQQRNEVEALLISRGGGSLEDMWCFNNESLARTIVQCPIPIIAAIGHEVDFTIADFVADLRAPTPSAAAELLTPDSQQLLLQLKQLNHRLFKQINNSIEFKQQQLDWLGGRLISPSQILKQKHKDIILNYNRLKIAVNQRLLNCRQAFKLQQSQLKPLSPGIQLNGKKSMLEQMYKRLQLTMGQKLQSKSNNLTSISQQLHTLSPLATLDRGYSITRKENNEIVYSAKQLSAGESIVTLLKEDKIISTITALNPRK